MAQGGGDFGEEFQIEELLIGALVGPVASESELVAILEPGRSLFDGGLFDVFGEWSLASAGRGTGKDVTAGISNAGERRDDG